MAAALKIGSATAAMSAPSAIAMATSMPDLIPPLAIKGNVGAPFFDMMIDWEVGMPHDENSDAVL